MTGDFRSIWHDLEVEVAAGTRAAPGNPLVRRLVGATTLSEVHFGIFVGDGLRCFLVRLPEGHHGGLPKLPVCSGLRAGIIQGEEQPRSRHFLLLKQEPGSPRDIFGAVAADVCDAVLADPTKSSELVVRARLERWSAFFAQGGARGLGPDAQKGLFGELWVLGRLLLPRLGPAPAVQAWVGPSRSNHDFIRSSRALEVKTSTSTQHHKIHVANERQLDDQGLDSLGLVVLFFAELEDGGLTLPGLVEELRLALAKDPLLAQRFNDLLLTAGYTDAQGERYSTGYAHRETRTYAVRENFPRLLEKDLPEGVGDLSYSVVLSACESFRLSTEATLAEFCSTPVEGRRP